MKNKTNTVIHTNANRFSRQRQMKQISNKLCKLYNVINGSNYY